MANPTIVLIHGAFADASGFRGLYDELLGEDVRIVAPPNPLRGLTGGDGEYIVRYSKHLTEAHLGRGVTSQGISRHAACGN
jgi:pimeloyl-ACP methyl ester carboxylesterase